MYDNKKKYLFFNVLIDIYELVNNREDDKVRGKQNNAYSRYRMYIVTNSKRKILIILPYNSTI